MDWFSCSCNVQGENLQGKMMNSLKKYKDVLLDRSKEHVLVNTNPLRESMELQVHANHSLTTL